MGAHETVKHHLSLPTAIFALCLIVAAATASPAAAQEVDIIATARAAATSGHRAEALDDLSAHLSETPRDVDARLLYGLVLSWEGRYDDARSQLLQVLEQSPAYTDAEVALMNVDWWSGQTAQARDRSNRILAGDPGHLQARRVRDSLDAAVRPWQASVSYAGDSFNDGRSPWSETTLSLTRRTSHGSVIVKASEARRFGYVDQIVEAEFYPTIRPGTYLFVGGGVAPDATLYPGNRVAFDIYQSVGAGVEVSGGFRRLDFGNVTSIYVTTVSKYLGPWMLTGKVFHVPGQGELDSTSYHGGFRRYVSGDGESYVGFTYSHGFSREEISNTADLTTMDSNSVRFDMYRRVAGHLGLSATIGTSRQERQNRSPSWQTSVTGGAAVRF